MTILNFPTGASTGTVYTGTNSVVYTFDGVKWNGNASTGGSGGGLSISDFGIGFVNTLDAGKITTSKLYNKNPNPGLNNQYTLEVTDGGVVVLPDQSIINGATLKTVAGNYAGITAGPQGADEDSWVWVDNDGATIATKYSTDQFTWKFANDGTLTLPNDGIIDYTTGSSLRIGGSDSGIGFREYNIQHAIAIGNGAQNTSVNTGSYSIAIGSGDDTGYEALDYSICIGTGAGYNDGAPVGLHSIAIGHKANYNRGHDNSITLNATGNELDIFNTGTFIAPIRADATTSATTYGIYYNPETKELTTSTAATGGGLSSPYSGIFTVTNTTVSTSTTTGALVVAGGVGVGGIVWAEQLRQTSAEVAIGDGAGASSLVSADYVSGGVVTTTLVVDLTTNIYPGMIITGPGFTSGQQVVSVINTTDLEIDVVADSTPSGTLEFTGTQGDYAVAIGAGAGNNTQGDTAVAVGFGAGNGNQGESAVAIGDGAGNDTQGLGAVAIGNNAGNDTQGMSAVAVGPEAGLENQGGGAVAIGYLAGNTNQGVGAVAIGNSAGANTQGESAVAIGKDAGSNTQGLYTVAIGFTAGANTQSDFSVAIGPYAGQTTQGQFALAVGPYAGQTNQGVGALAVGNNAGQITQQTDAIAIGTNAGNTNQGAFAIAIGTNAGITDQPAQSIVINATAANLSGTQAGFYIDPIRADATTSATTYGIYYNPETKELTTSTAATFPDIGAPTSSEGAVGDKAGMIAVNSSSIFYCISDFTPLPNSVTVDVVGGDGGGSGLAAHFTTVPEAGWTLNYNGQSSLITTVNPQGDWYVVFWTDIFTIPTSAVITYGPSPLSNIWVKQAWGTTGSW